jgi:hypothetical protein
VAYQIPPYTQRQARWNTPGDQFMEGAAGAVLPLPRLAAGTTTGPSTLVPYSPKEVNMSSNQWTRREILKAGAAAMALPTLVPATALGRDGAAAAGETVRVGVIGCGGRSQWLISEVAADVKGFKVVAACDCIIQRAQRFAKDLSGGANWGVYADFRKMIEKEKLDAVMVETTTHARAWIVIQAMQAGVDTYIEKPMCLTIAEGRAMVNAARKYRRVTQVGSARCR